MHVFWQVKKFPDHKYLSVFFFNYNGRQKFAEGMGQLESQLVSQLTPGAQGWLKRSESANYLYDKQKTLWFF